MAAQQPLLSVNLSVEYAGRSAVLQGVSFQMQPGEILGLVGQSGSGKSTLALAILRLLELRGGRARGQVVFQGRDLLALSEGEMRAIRGRDIGLILQSPLSSLNPALRIGTQLTEAWRAHATDGKGLEERLQDILGSLCLPTEESFRRRYPDEISIGQAQRVLVAMAAIHRPALLIADEPTSALDVITQAELLRLFAGLNRSMGTGILYISHDLLSVANFCHRTAILHEGRIVECDETDQVFQNPQDPYTKRLVASLPRAKLIAKPFA